jgi:hypothetical protein
MYIETSSPAQNGDTFDLNYDGGGCAGAAEVQFYYHMYEPRLPSPRRPRAPACLDLPYAAPSLREHLS